MMEPVNAILKHEPANRRLENSPRDISFLSSLSIIHAVVKPGCLICARCRQLSGNFKFLSLVSLHLYDSH